MSADAPHIHRNCSIPITLKQM